MSELELRRLVEDLHAGHNIGGNSLECIQCVVSALNQYEQEYVQRVKDMQDGK